MNTPSQERVKPALISGSSALQRDRIRAVFILPAPGSRDLREVLADGFSRAIDVLRGSNAGEPSQTLADHGTSRQKCDVIKKLAIDMCRGQRRSYRVQIIARRYINVTLR
jgi:hypothetical protein